MGRRAGGGETRPGLLLELRLPAPLRLLHPRDLVLDGREKPLALRELALDRALLGCALTDDLRLAGAVGAQPRAPGLHFRAEALEVLQDLRVLSADPLGHLEPVEEVVEALGAEDHLDGAPRIAVDVERPEPLGNVLLGDAEA